jgi:multiple sugar transport system permease protein
MRQRDKTQALLFLSLCAFTAVNLMPVIWGVLTSIKQPVDAFSVPPKLIFVPTFEFHWQVWVEKAFWHYLINSVVISVSTVVTSVSIGTMAAYGLSRMRNQASRGLLFGLLAMRMFPHILLAIPFFVLAKSLGLINTYPAMVLALVAINQPFTIWLMRSFFVDVPHELYEAAAIDGCSAWQVFARVALPVVRPGLWVTALFSLLLAYNEFLFALVLTGPDTKTLPVAIAEYGGEDINYWSLSAAAAVGIMLPIARTGAGRDQGLIVRRRSARHGGAGSGSPRSEGADPDAHWRAMLQRRGCLRAPPLRSGSSQQHRVALCCRRCAIVRTAPEATNPAPADTRRDEMQ